MRRNALALSTAIAALLGALPAHAAGGETCASATTIATLPFIDASADSCGFENDVTNTGPAACADLPVAYPGPDVFYKIVLGTGNNVAFSLTMPSGATGDLALFLIDDPSCSAAGKCAGNSVDVKGAGQGPERIKSASYPPGTYYIVVDSAVAQGVSGSCGTYTLSVNGTVGTVPPNVDGGAAIDGGAVDAGAGGASNGGTGGGGASSVGDASTDAGKQGDGGSVGITETGGTGAGATGAGGTASGGGATSRSGGASGANTGGGITDAGLAGNTADASSSGASSGSSGCGCTIDASGHAAPAGFSAVALALGAWARRRRRRRSGPSWRICFRR